MSLTCDPRQDQKISHMVRMVCAGFIAVKDNIGPPYIPRKLDQQSPQSKASLGGGHKY